MKRIAIEEVHARKVRELGLDPTAVDLTSIEAIAGSLRRMASFVCPCPPATLVHGVLRPLRGLVDDFAEMKEAVQETLEAMIAHGDLLEHRVVGDERDQQGAALIYAAPAAFVPRSSGSTILIGVAVDQLSALPDELEARIEHVAHVRRLCALPDEDLRTELLELGLLELVYDRWLKGPAAEPAAAHVSRLDQLLDAAQPSRNIPGLVLLDPQAPVRYYPGRWVDPRSRSGRFVGRRSQAYGANLWCYVELSEGRPVRLVDFPAPNSRWRGCDEAWRLQMAIDAQRGERQQFRLAGGPGETRVLEFFSPVPMWARRRWDAVGEPIPRAKCLFAYRFPGAEIDEELQFVCQELWLAEGTRS